MRQLVVLVFVLSLHWFFTTTSKQRKLMTLEESSTVHCHWKVVGREHNIVLTLPFPLLLPSSSSPSPIHSLPLLFLPSSPSPPSFLSPLPLPSSFRYPFSLPFPFLLPYPIFFSLYTPSSTLFPSHFFLPPYSPSTTFFSLYPHPLSLLFDANSNIHFPSPSSRARFYPEFSLLFS